MRIAPLGAGHWFLLGIGLAMAPFWAAAIGGGWLLVCGWLTRTPDRGGLGLFNLRQLAILGWMGGLFRGRPLAPAGSEEGCVA